MEYGQKREVGERMKGEGEWRGRKQTDFS